MEINRGEVVERIRALHERVCVDPHDDGTQFLHFLESLTQYQWRVLLVDIVLEDSGYQIDGIGWASSLFRMRRSFGAIVEFAVHFGQLMPRTRKRICRVLSRIVRECLESPRSALESQLIKGVLCWVPDGVDSEILVNMVRDSDLPIELRSEAARELLNHQGFRDSVPLSFWKGLDVERDYFLASYIMVGMAESSPLEALSVIRYVRKKPEHPEEFYHTGVKVVKSLVQDGSKGALKKVFNSLPRWAKNYFRKEVFTSWELKKYRTELGDL